MGVTPPYFIICYLNKKIRVIDLLHAFSPEYKKSSEKISLPYVKYIHRRIVLGIKTLNDYKKQYIENNLDLSLISRIKVIPNKIDASENFIKKPENKIKKVLFVARNSSEKRSELLLDIANECHDRNMSIEFYIVGDFPNNFTELENVHIVGVLNKSELNQLYQNADFICITSWREGLPMVMLEAMGYGVIPISTEVGEITSCISHLENGVIIQDNSIQHYMKRNKEYKKEYIKTKEAFVIELNHLINNDILRKELSENAHSTVKNNFSTHKFNQSYRDVIFG